MTKKSIGSKMQIILIIRSSISFHNICSFAKVIFSERSKDALWKFFPFANQIPTCSLGILLIINCIAIDL